MFHFPSVTCTRCTGFFCLAIIKGPPNDIYCIIEEPYKHYFTEKVSYSHKYRLSAFLSVIQTLLCKVVVWCNVLILVVKIQEFCPDCTCCVDF